MSFGFGVSDCIILLTLVNSICQKYSAANKQYETLQDEVGKMGPTIEDIHMCLDALKQKNIECPRWMRTSPEDCKRLLDNVAGYLNQYRSLGQSSTKAAERAKWAWNDKYEEFREQLRGQSIALSQSYLGILTRVVLDTHGKLSHEPKIASTLVSQPAQVLVENRDDTWMHIARSLEEAGIPEALISAIKSAILTGQMPSVSEIDVEESPAEEGQFSTQPPVSDIGSSLSMQTSAEEEVGRSTATRKSSIKKFLNDFGSSGSTLDVGFAPSGTPCLRKMSSTSLSNPE
ncbi:MAG: hypothetical protein M1827_002577 [Pycnora praestabilis]|nr:MAG: hypothetical protein M1827_002577 [Pycnora praestabilis]